MKNHPPAGDQAPRPRGFPPRLALYACLLVPVAAAAWLFAPAIFGNLMLWGSDIQALGFPLELSARRFWAAGQWPVWTPELLGGLPGIASTNLVFLYPTVLLFTALGVPVPDGFGYDAFLQACLSAWGTYFFLRSLGSSRGAGLLGALSFAFSGTQLSLLYAGHTNNLKAIALIPWAFYGVHEAFRRDRMSPRAWLGWTITGLALGLQILAIGMQIFAYTILALAAFAAWIAWKTPRSETTNAETRPAGWLQNPWVFGLLGLGAALALAALISSPQLLPSLEYKPYSWRENFSYDSFTSWSFHPKEAIGWLVPGFYGWMGSTYRGDWPFCLSTEYFGLLPWALAAGALAALWPVRKGPARFFLGLAAASFLIGLGKHTPLHLIFYHLPVYSGFRTWARFLCLLTFSVSVLAGLGWDALWDQRNAARARLGGLAMAGLALAAGLACVSLASGVAASSKAALASGIGSVEAARSVTEGLIKDSAWHAFGFALGLGLVLLALGRLRNPGKAASLALVLFAGAHLADLRDMHTRYVTFKDPASLTARLAWLSLLPDPRTGEPYRVFAQDGFWPQNQEAYYGLESVGGYHGMVLASCRKLKSAMDKRQDAYLNLMGARYLFFSSPLNIPWLKPMNSGPPFIYENPRACPRAFLAGQTRVAPGTEEAFQQMADPSLDPRQTAVVEKGAALPGSEPVKGSVAWISRAPDRFTLKVENDRPACLVITQNWYPGWQALVDGKEAEILHADGALQGLMLQPGGHEVRLSFKCPRLGQGMALCVIGLLLASGLAWLSYRRRPRLSPTA